MYSQTCIYRTQCTVKPVYKGYNIVKPVYKGHNVQSNLYIKDTMYSLTSI